MKQSCFSDIATEVFSCIQQEYGLMLESTSNVLHYTNATFDFSVYFERSFEIYICFRVNNSHLRLYDMAKWIELKKSDIDLIERNQTSNVDSMVFILKNLCDVMKRVLRKLQNEPDLLYTCLKNQQSYEENQRRAASNAYLLSQLQEAWLEKNFDSFLLLVEGNMDDIRTLSSAERILKQAQYAKNKKSGNGYLS